ncbi:tumor necrosis factor alpha-induced protein 2-like [Hyperolius riggenbachi]|uniref:tumor necrosis factor alpha-induced protein 2-like n=1 Tax=Hyperolius riggenbachi TaxID=752182 RepID=UPI0035A28ACA
MSKWFTSFKKFINKKFIKSKSKKKSPHPEDVPLVLSDRSVAGNDHSCVASIEKCIQGKEYVDAVKALMSVQRNDEVPTMADEVERLYALLEDKLLEVVKKPFMKVDGSLMDQAVRAIKEQVEKESNSSKEDPTAPNKIKPRNWLNKWIQCAESSVAERFSNISQSSRSGNASCNYQHFEDMMKICKTDLIEVVNNIKTYWSQDTNICTVYARKYHALLGSEITSLLEFALSEDDSQFLLCWMQKHYPQQILNDPTISKGIDTQDLGPLVEPRKLRKLERNYVTSAKINMEESMNTKLQNEVKSWKGGKEPKKMENYYNLQLQEDIIQEYRSKLEKADEISESMHDKMRSALSGVLEQFLYRYNEAVSKYISRKRKNFELIVVANINCNKMLRDFVASGAVTLESWKQREVIPALQATEDRSIEVLLCDVCKAVKTLFIRLSYKKDHEEVIKIVIERLRIYLNSPHLRGLNPSSHKVVINKLHLKVVQGYIAQLLEKPKRWKEIEKLRTAGKSMKKSAKLINKFFEDHKTEEEWLFRSLLLIADIIIAEDTGNVCKNISELLKTYPDSYDHVATILYIKGNMDIPQARSVLDQFKKPPVGNPNCTLFSSIRPWPDDWLSGTEKLNFWKRIKAGFRVFKSFILCCDCLGEDFTCQ